MITVKLPRLGEMTEEALFIEWLVAVGDVVEAGAPLALVDTDKVESEIPAPAAGRVVELFVAPEEELAVGTDLCTIEPAAPEQRAS